MSNPLYPVNLTVTIPTELLDIGRKVTQALDQDVGGANSWMPVRYTGDETATPDCYVADAPCTEGFKETVLKMLASPAYLQAAVATDFAVRWADQVPPTLQECEAFCAGAVVPEEPVIEETP